MPDSAHDAPVEPTHTITIAAHRPFAIPCVVAETPLAECSGSRSPDQEVSKVCDSDDSTTVPSSSSDEGAELAATQEKERDQDPPREWVAVHGWGLIIAPPAVAPEPATSARGHRRS